MKKVSHKDEIKEATKNADFVMNFDWGSIAHETVSSTPKITKGM